ncbi:MAG: hypothetical protein AAF488_02405 [Planctomycetota bacterium]
MDRPHPSTEVGTTELGGAGLREARRSAEEIGVVGSAHGEAPDLSDQEFDKLRNLLLGGDRARIEEVEAKLEEAGVSVDQVADVLPAAVARRMQTDGQLAHALSPAIEQTVEVSIAKNPEKLATALSPIMMPAIRKSIADQIRSMVQSLNRTLELGFSIRGLKLRMEAARTGRPFAEVVLLRSLVFRVEHVFLIHRDSALLLAQVGRGDELLDNADLVTSMLSAIQDFVRDSFGGDRDDSNLSTLEFGDRTIWIERGPTMVLAAVIRGTAPIELRKTFSDTLQSLHQDHARNLTEFSGDTAPFELAEPKLTACCRQVTKEEKRGLSPVLGMVLIAIVAGLAIWLVSDWTRAERENEFLRLLEREPGIVVVRHDRVDGALRVVCLRDPSSRDPWQLVDIAHLERSAVTFDLAEFRSLNSDLLLQQARRLLTPPDSVELAVNEDKVLVVTGEASGEWISTARSVALAGLGIPIDARGLAITGLGELERAIRSLEVLPVPVLEGDWVDSLAFDRTSVPRLLQKLNELAARSGRHATVVFRGHSLTQQERSEVESLTARWCEALAGHLERAEVELGNTRLVAGPSRPEMRAEHWTVPSKTRWVLTFDVEVDQP